MEFTVSDVKNGIEKKFPYMEVIELSFVGNTFIAVGIAKIKPDYSRVDVFGRVNWIDFEEKKFGFDLDFSDALLWEMK